MIYFNHKNIYKQCKEVTDIKSHTYTKYKKEVKNKLSTILSTFSWIGFGSSLLIPVRQPSVQFSVRLVLIILFIIVPALFLYFRYKHHSLFAKDPDFKKMALPSDLNTYTLLYSEVTDKLEENKKAVRKTFHLLKNIFIIIVIGSFEDNIKNFVISALYLTNLIQWLIFIWLFIIISFYCLHLSSLIGYVMEKLIDIENKLNFCLDRFIDHGMFVREYLISTIKILEQKNDKVNNNKRDQTKF